MKKLSAILTILIFSQPLFSQKLDSLYNEFVTGVSYSKNSDLITSDIEPIKCATNHLNYIRKNYDKLSLDQKNQISVLLQRPETDTSFVTPSGYFRVHYDLSGINKPGYDLNELAAALDSSYIFEIEKLGYLEPPGDNGEGGDNLYDVYIQDIGIIYGYTDFFLQPNSPSYMTIDNDFDVHYTTGIDGAKVTVAHEFHHAIQVGNYTYRSEDSYYYEMLSTSMEEFVFDSINDYYDYMPAFFRNAQAPFYSTSGGGYDLAVWNIFLKDKYGYDVIKRSLEYLSDFDALESIAQSIGAAGGSFKDDFAEFAIWNYFTGSRAKENEYFEEAVNYPKIKPAVSLPFEGNSENMTVNSNPASINYLRYIDLSRGLPDTLVSIITNSDYLNKARTQFEYTVYKYEASGASKINDIYYSKLSSLNKTLFVESAVFNNELASTGNTEREEVEFAYPQPFSYSKHSFVFLPTEPHISGRSTLNVYTSGMDLVFSGEKNIFASNKIVVRWDGKSNDGGKLPTGIYIFVTKAGDKVKKGKLVIYNE